MKHGINILKKRGGGYWCQGHKNQSIDLVAGLVFKLNGLVPYNIRRYRIFFMHETNSLRKDRDVISHGVP